MSRVLSNFSSMRVYRNTLPLSAKSLSVLSIGLLVVSGCVAPKEKEPPKSKTVVTKTEHINTETKFSSKEFGVAGSPRVTSAKRTRKGGGRFQIGKPYKIRGQWYTPKEDPNLKQVGLASWYGPNFHGRLTANGEIYDQYGISAAHPTMPLPSYAFVTNLENGRKIKVRVNDRGPYSRGRVIDLSARAAELLGYTKQGVAKVRVEYAGRAQMDGLDEKLLLASYVGPNVPALEGTDSLGSGTMIAMADTGSNSGAASAINQSFQPAANTLTGGIPVPTDRPTLFEGVPLANNSSNNDLTRQVERVVYQSVKPSSVTVLDRVPRPLAYASEPEFELAYVHKVANETVSNAHFSNEIRISIGEFKDTNSVKLLGDLIENAGTLETESGKTDLITIEKHANQILDYLHEIGLRQAKIL